MEEAQALSFRLESYLVQLADINRRWAEWLGGCETAVVAVDLSRLQSMEPMATSLMQELTQVQEDRKQLLDDAQRCGLPHANLRSLARGLPAWDKPSLRGSLVQAAQQLSNLRRLHVATWVMLSQALQFTAGSMQLMNAGNSQRHVYMADEKADTGGGRLLDASL
ncbi:MAG: flagellar export chaperone FlgN [Planctomycetales bacterium]|nr:flagellar export chaperone FlgN [Planctomycetales bacterium]